MITRLTVLYDASCGLCRTARSWLAGRSQLVPLEFVAAGSDEARRRYPALEVEQTLADITVVADDGGVYTGDAAWIMCLWALEGYRGLAARLAQPHLRPLARQVARSAGSLREALKRRDGYGRDCGGTCDI
ncbi:thiol-disulfide oxidoreductase DCC family protein [Dactylosporangium sp. CA-139066]|uniref:thiol-disulfide oxidoreductase DCC family protein n=1 Tax=Dactylosporangium sp. CA-139066 TaxID=3239930 RepID=UPI003D9383D0